MLSSFFRLPGSSKLSHRQSRRRASFNAPHQSKTTMDETSRLLPRHEQYQTAAGHDTFPDNYDEGPHCEVEDDAIESEGEDTAAYPPPLLPIFSAAHLGGGLLMQHFKDSSCLIVFQINCQRTT